MRFATRLLGTLMVALLTLAPTMGTHQKLHTDGTGNSVWDVLRALGWPV